MIDISKLTGHLRGYASAFGCQTMDGSNRDFDLTAARVLRAIADSIEYAEEASDDGIDFEMREAMQEFVDRCENGEVLSKYTYAKFKEILERSAE